MEDFAEEIDHDQFGSASISNPVLVSIPARDKANESVTLMVEHPLRLAGHCAPQSSLELEPRPFRFSVRLT